MDNPELEGKLGGESQEGIGLVNGPEVQSEVIAETKAKLNALPESIKNTLDQVAPDLAAAAYDRAEELRQVFAQQLDKLAEGDASSYGSFDTDNATIDSGRESLSPAEIESMIDSLNGLADLLVMQAAGQEGDTKVIDMDAMNNGEPRVVSEFWYLISGEREFGPGHQVEVGSTVLSTTQEQGQEGLGSSSRQVIIRSVEKAA